MPISYGKSIVGTSGINGDAFYISSDNSTLVLSDGASGAGADGKVAMSSCCIENIKAFPYHESGLTPKEYIDKIVWKINNDLINLSQESNKYIFGTVIVCIIENNTLTVASVGDSPAYLIKENTIERIAKTKKKYDNLIQMGIFTESQLEEYVHRLPEHLWSMFDTFIPSVVPKYAVEEYILNINDVVVLCCDGVSDYLTEKELVALIDGNKLTDSTNAIIEKAKSNSIEEHKRIQYDDITLVIYKH